MKRLSAILILCLIGFYAFSQNAYVPEKFKSGLLKTKTGARVIYNGEKTLLLLIL